MNKDMDSDLTHSYSNESIDQDPDDEMSHAAISMISSISPQFTNDFFSRTKLKRLQTRKFSNHQIQKTSKTSKFARYNKEDDFNLKKQESESNQDKSELNQSSNSQQQDEQVNNNKLIQPQLAVIVSRENDPQYSSGSDYQYDNILEDKNVDNLRDDNQSNNFLETEIIEENINTERTQNNDKKYSMMSTEENLLPRNPLVSPKTAFLNLTRPRDPKLEQLKQNQKFNFLDSSFDKIEDIQELSQRKESIKKYSIVLQNQEGDQTPSDQNIQTEQNLNIEKTNQRLHFIKGEALKNFASDFSKASSKRFQQSKVSSSSRNIENNTPLAKMKRQYMNNNNSYGGIKSQQNIPKIPLTEQFEEYSFENISNSQKKRKNSQQIDIGRSSQISKDIGGYLSPISHVIEGSPYNFTQFSDIGKQGFSLSNEQPSPSPLNHQTTSPQLKSLMNRLNTFKFNSINEENSESSQIIQKETKDYSIRSPIKNDQYQNSPQNSWKSGKTSPSKKQDEQTELQKYENSPDYIKQETLFSNNNPYILDFDRMKEFELYFPEDNYEHKIAKYNQYRRKTKAYKNMIIKKKNQVRKKLAIFNKLHL